VLQAMILTDKEKMLLTPTYHVFEMFKVHQDAKHVPVEIESPPAYEMNGKSIPQLSAGASRDEKGRLHLSIANLHHDQPAMVKCSLKGATASKITGRILTAPAINTHNTFDSPDRVKPAAFDGAKASGDALTVELPAKSVVVLEIA
jgi:alpha-N-arabinofuranosidase